MEMRKAECLWTAIVLGTNGGRVASWLLRSYGVISSVSGFGERSAEGLKKRFHLLPAGSLTNGGSVWERLKAHTVNKPILSCPARAFAGLALLWKGWQRPAWQPTDVRRGRRRARCAGCAERRGWACPAQKYWPSKLIPPSFYPTFKSAQSGMTCSFSPMTLLEGPIKLTSKSWIFVCLNQNPNLPLTALSQHPKKSQTLFSLIIRLEEMY